MVHRFPNALSNEWVKLTYVDYLFSIVISYVNTKFKVEKKHVWCSTEVLLHTNLEGDRQLVKADFAVWKNVDDLGISRKCLLVVQCCARSCDEEVKQCVACLKAIYTLNGDGKTVYGFCSTGKWFTLPTILRRVRRLVIEALNCLGSSTFCFLKW